MKWRLARDLETRVTVRKEHGRSAVLPRSRLGLEVSLDGDFAFGFLWRGFATGRLNLESLRNMPYSSDVFDNTIQELLFKWRFETYLDIGPGAGKFGRMVKSIVPHCHITAVEIESEYVESFHLREVYDAIILSDALVLLNGDQNRTYDVVILGDVIEHLLKADGQNLIHFLAYRCKRMLVVYPTKYVQYAVGSKPSESHRSSWLPSDFEYFRHEVLAEANMTLVIVHGFLDDQDATLCPNG
jgi:hypothetical protein